MPLISRRCARAFIGLVSAEGLWDGRGTWWRCEFKLVKSWWKKWWGSRGLTDVAEIWHDSAWPFGCIFLASSRSYPRCRAPLQMRSLLPRQGGRTELILELFWEHIGVYQCLGRHVCVLINERHEHSNSSLLSSATGAGPVCQPQCLYRACAYCGWAIWNADPQQFEDVWTVRRLETIKSCAFRSSSHCHTHASDLVSHALGTIW